MLPRVRHCTHAGDQMLPGELCIKPSQHAFHRAEASPLCHVHCAYTHVRQCDALSCLGSQVTSIEVKGSALCFRMLKTCGDI